MTNIWYISGEISEISEISEKNYFFMIIINDQYYCVVLMNYKYYRCTNVMEII